MCVELALLSSFRVELIPALLFGNGQGTGVVKSYLKYFIIRLIVNNDHSMPD